jgi:hypothetical protein
MISRRSLLVGVSASALIAYTMPKALAVVRPLPEQDMNIGILVDVVKDFLRHIDAFGGPSSHWEPVGSWYREWSTVQDSRLPSKIIETLEEIYQDPEFVEIKARKGSILYEDGRMNVIAQHIFAMRFPMNLQFAGNRKTFQAFAAFAPAHLL